MVKLDHIVHLLDDRFHILTGLAGLHEFSGIHGVCSGFTRHYIVLAGSRTQGVYVRIVALRTAQYIMSGGAGLTKGNLQRRKPGILNGVD